MINLALKPVRTAVGMPQQRGDLKYWNGSASVWGNQNEQIAHLLLPAEQVFTVGPERQSDSTLVQKEKMVSPTGFEPVTN